MHGIIGGRNPEDHCPVRPSLAITFGVRPALLIPDGRFLSTLGPALTAGAVLLQTRITADTAPVDNVVEAGRDAMFDHDLFPLLLQSLDGIFNLSGPLPLVGAAGNHHLGQILPLREQLLFQTPQRRHLGE